MCTGPRRDGVPRMSHHYPIGSMIRLRRIRLSTLALPVAVAATAAFAGGAAAAPTANVEVGALGTTMIQSSAFGAQSYRLRNDGDVPIIKLRIDLAGGPAMFPDIVFDPAGGAGNEIGKPFTVDVAPPLVTATATYDGGSIAQGFSVLEVEILPGLGPGEELKFSLDTDPTVLRDSIAGPNGKISGAEHHGATVAVTYDATGGALTQTADLVKDLGSDIQSTVKLPAGAETAPQVAMAGGGAPAVVGDPVQTVTVTGAVGATGIVLVAEGHLFLAGTNGFDVDPFEANVLVGYGEYPFTIGPSGSAEVPVALTRRTLSSLPDAPAGAESEKTGINYITAWTTAPGGGTSPVSAPIVREWDGTVPPGPAPDPPDPLPIPPVPPAPTDLIAVPAGILGLANCGPVSPARPAGSGGGTITLSADQLRTNQRIGQAAIRRLNAIQAWLDTGIEARDICGGTLGPRELGAGLAQAPGAAPLPTRADPRPLRIATASGSGTITLTPGQLRINQRIYRAALLRARALEERISGQLTGGDVRDGSLGSDRFAVPLSVTPGATAAAASVTTSVSLTDKGRAIVLSAAQLKTNQRIAQQAVREANALRAKLERGLVGVNFRPASIGAADISFED